MLDTLAFPPSKKAPTLPPITAEITHAVLQQLSRHLNVLSPNRTERTLFHPAHRARIAAAVQRDAPIQMVLPAFPAKSPNPQKTMGVLPDLGEVLALERLQGICERIGDVYAPGAELVICSDGRVFSDLVLVSDAHVSDYRKAIVRILAERGLDRLRTFDLDDVFGATDFERMRLRLVEQYGRSAEAVRADVKKSESARLLFNGIHRFIFEDQRVVGPPGSTNQVRKRSKAIAYEVIRRSNAWSALLEVHFPQALRLSIHPQPLGAQKIGVRLVRSGNPWRTPWHSVVLHDGRNYMLVPREAALSMGATCRDLDGYPFYALSESA